MMLLMVCQVRQEEPHVHMDSGLSQDMWTQDGVGLCMIGMYMTLLIVYS
jgi:hypothetical protein